MDTRIVKVLLAAAVVTTTTAPAAQANEPATRAPTQEALRMVRDAQTGKMRAPTQEELQRMIQGEQAAARRAPQTAAASAAGTVRHHAGGMKSMVLGPEHLISVQARRDAQGNLVIRHEDPKDEHPATARDLPTE